MLYSKGYFSAKKPRSTWLTLEWTGKLQAVLSTIFFDNIKNLHNNAGICDD